MVLLSHLGEAKPALGISSHELVAATRGIDVVLDGHTHSVIERDDVMNLDGVLVPVTQTGTQFANVGKLVITADGHISTTLIAADDIPYESDLVNATIDSVSKEMAAVVLRQVATTDYYSGGGFYDKLKNCRLVTNATFVDRDALADYLEKTLSGIVPAEYAAPQGRITIVDD